MGAAHMENRLEEALGVLGPIVIWVFFGGVGRGKAPDTLIGTAHQGAPQVVSAYMPVPGFQQQ